jgi:integrase
MSTSSPSLPPSAPPPSAADPAPARASARARRKPRYGDGTLYQRGRVWWIKLYVDGRPHYESTGTEHVEEARRVLDKRRGQRASGAPIRPRLDRVTYAEAAQALRDHYRVTGDRDVAEAEGRLAHLDRVFAGRRLVTIGPSDGERYALGRQRDGAANATVNRELAVLGRLLRLAVDQGQLLQAPRLAKLAEAPPRAGFVDQSAFEALRQHLPPDLQVVVTIAYTFGWRRNEVLNLQQRHLDLAAGTLRLDPGSTKNDDGRVVHLTAELVGLLRAQLTRVRRLEQARGAVVSALFPHLAGRFAGRPIRDFRKAWTRACQRAGVPGLLKHDLRRSAVRNMEQAGVPRSVAMKLTGHKTEAIYRRYAMVSPADLKAAAARLDGYRNSYTRPRRLETRRATG